MEQLREGLRSFRLPSFDADDSDRVNFEGRWWKDKQASDMGAYDAALDLLQLGGLQKKGAHMIHGLDISQDDETFTAKFLMPGVPFFKPTERYRFEEPTAIRRRDMRKGEQTCMARAGSGKIEVTAAWDEPCAGSVKEVYTSPEPGTLRVESITRVGDKVQQGLQVYRKQ